MKKVISLIFSFVLVLIFSGSVAGQKADFTGTWKLDRSKIPVTGNFPVLVQITINIKGDSVLTERLYETGDGQQYPFSENVTLDGKECMITVYEMPRKSKAKWSEQDMTLTLESTTTANGSTGPEDYKSIETWAVDEVNKILTISFKNSSPAGESGGAFIFNKSGQIN
jgi:hypothetical protein